MTRRFGVAASAVAALCLLGSCAVIPSGPQSGPAPAPSAKPSTATSPTPVPPPGTPATAPVAKTAVESGIVAGPAYRALNIPSAQALAALKAFRLSCPSARSRTDGSGLTRSGDWEAPCAAAASWPDRDAAAFFESHFRTVRVGTGAAMATGYYEPEILGSRTRQPGYTIPVYRRPNDLIDVDLGKFSDAFKGKRIRGRLSGLSLVPYYSRTEIETGALANRGLEIAWAADAAEFFFLQIQGSGRLRLPDGSVMRIGYDSQNGHDYVGIGKLLKDRGELGPGKTSMQGIMAYLNADPVRGQAVMRENPSYIFFRELTGAGPLGALGVPVVGRASVAADPNFVPLGAPVVLNLDRTEANGLWVAQDTGGAIKGANRFDTFWGAGDEARRIAGGMMGRGTAVILLPRAAVERLVPTAP